MHTGQIDQTLTHQCELIDLGLVNYKDAYQIQQNYVEEVLVSGVEKIILCEHPTVLTMGRMSSYDHLLVDALELSKKNIELVEIDRGGDITLHAPGQLIVYPILDLTKRIKDLHKYLNDLETVIIETLSQFDVESTRNRGKTGVWIDKKKIASIGIGVRKWITYHGIGINISTDLSLFSLIKPCGLDVTMTSLSQVKNQDITVEQVKNKVIEVFKKKFQLNFMGAVKND